MLVEQLFSFEVFIWGHHYIIEIAIGYFKVVKSTDVPLSWNLWSDIDVTDGCQFAFLHKA